MTFVRKCESHQGGVKGVSNERCDGLGGDLKVLREV